MILNFFSFLPRNFDLSIAHLQTALQQIASWMSANILTLNSSKTEFLIIGLKKQLSEKDNSHHSIPFILHENLVSFLMNILTSLIRSRHCLSPNKLTQSIIFISLKHIA